MKARSRAVGSNLGHHHNARLSFAATISNTACFVCVRAWCLSTFCWLVNLQQILNACKFLTGLQLSSGRPFPYNCYFCPLFLYWERE